MKIGRMISLLLVLTFVAGCASQIPPEKPNPGENLLWSTSEQRPQWTFKEVESKGNKVRATGISNKYTTEKYARQDAVQDARKKIVQYASTRVKDRIENAVEQSGRSSETLDPLRVQREYETQISKGALSKLKVDSVYMEKWLDDEDDVYWHVFVSATINKDVLKESLENIIKEEHKKLQQRMHRSESRSDQERIRNLLKELDEIENEDML